MPGVYGTTDTSGLQQGGSGRGIIQPGISSNGARGNMVNYSLDGAYHNDGYTNVSLPIADPDTLREFCRAPASTLRALDLQHPPVFCTGSGRTGKEHVSPSGFGVSDGVQPESAVPLRPPDEPDLPGMD